MEKHGISQPVIDALSKDLEIKPEIALSLLEKYKREREEVKQHRVIDNVDEYLDSFRYREKGL